MLSDPGDTCSFSGIGGGERQIYSRPLTTVREEEGPSLLASGQISVINVNCCTFSF